MLDAAISKVLGVGRPSSHFSGACPCVGADCGPGSPGLYFTLAVLCVLLESLPGFDRLFQAPFFSGSGWMIGRELHASLKPWLYTGPKILVAVTGGVFLLVFTASYSQQPWGKKLLPWRRPALLMVLAIALVPLFAAALKAVTGVYSPLDTLPYGGTHPHRGFLEHFWVYGKPDAGRSFPAGHASGGFALLALYYLPLRRKAFLVAAGLFAGWFMGLYQMARGEHFLSHTLATMFLALFLITLLAQRLKLQR